MNIKFMHCAAVFSAIPCTCPGAMVGKLSADAASEEQRAYGKAGAVAEEVFSLIRTVTAFGGKKRETVRYERELTGTQKQPKGAGKESEASET